MLQLLKETAMRIGEAGKLRWIDVNFENNTVTVNDPEKGGNPRMIKISSKLAAMLNALPKKHERVFGKILYQSLTRSLSNARRKTANKLQNPRLLYIHFHTLRHWKATMIYHRTKDLIYLREMLGHKSFLSTLRYTHLVNFQGDEYSSAIAKNIDEAKVLIETGFEYVSTFENVMLFRKRK